MFSSSIPGRVAPTGREPNLPGDKYGRLTLVSEVSGQTVRPSMRSWSCVCECGTEKDAVLHDMRTGHTGSCGCLNRERATRCNTTHGMRNSKAYDTWSHMIQRCTNPGNKSYANYGGRGIKVCDRWLKFENFLADMGEAAGNLSIDRIDNSGPYAPGNCRWATAKEQARNQRSNRLVSYRGKNISLAEAAELAGLNYKMVHARLNRHTWPISRALGSTEFSEPC